MALSSMRAKGVSPANSRRATLPGWKLTFDVAHFFRHEGGVANVVETGNPGDQVCGVLHLCDDSCLADLDAAEAYGYGYDRVTLPVYVDNQPSPVPAIVYKGLPAFIDHSCLPSRRYLNILIKGATSAGLETEYIRALEAHPTHRKQAYPRFLIPDTPSDRFDANSLSQHPSYTALADAVFDLSAARPRHEFLKKFFGGKDMTLFHLRRMDSSDGTESEQDIRDGRLSAAQLEYLNEYLHEYAAEYRFAGRFLRD